ncbi:hypothetical protein PH5382_00838 [Phaeobacter sp. CECT 5382]|nr:hypothetical protein [Phaeobacter sp. CECT 5382]CUH86919.1 hypothetical protein PH5382_00838 [Phaeobacter sp. CECT 5382]
MGRLIRLVFFVGIAFTSGILFERSHQKDLCAQSGGQWMRAGFCAGE